jgi:Fe-S cluster assembly protein SufB
VTTEEKLLEGIDEYRYGFIDPEVNIYKAPQKGLSREIVEKISSLKNEPPWMLEFRLKALEHFEKRPMPQWGGDLSTLNLDEIYFYNKPTESESKSWDDVPDTIKNTFKSSKASNTAYRITPNSSASTSAQSSR